MASLRSPTIDERQFIVLWLLGVGWVALFVGASVIYRLREGKYIFWPRFRDSLFLERWRSGRSLRSVLTSLGGASRCLWIAVTTDELAVGPHFPFNLMFLPEFYGLEHRLRGNDIVLAEQIGRPFLGSRVLIRFRRPNGDLEGFEIRLKDAQAFLHAVEELRQQSAAGAK
jgi:hypothetical protein